ncbi:MAG: TonB-dependent receptor domain-containing protein, partial [Vicinamibacteraceae bacterium]
MRPFTLSPTIYVNNSNDRTYPNEQDRVATLFTGAFGQWVSETRFGWNRTHIERLDAFLNQKKPGFTGEDSLYDLRVPNLSISGGFSTPTSEIYILSGTTYSFEQKISRSLGRHFMKTGFRFVRNSGNKLTPENPRFAYESLEDALTNTAQSAIVDFSSPPYTSDLDEFGLFIQDDWRVGNDLTLNLGLRYDYYAVIKVSAASEIPVEFVNLAPASDLRRLDFGPALDPEHPYDPDWGLAPRLGFAWKVRGSSDTVLRGGLGYLYSPHLPGMIRQSIADPTAPFRFSYNRTEVAERAIGFPMYTEGFRDIVNADAMGRKTIFSVFDRDMEVPHTIQSMLSLQ